MITIATKSMGGRVNPKPHEGMRSDCIYNRPVLDSPELKIKRLFPAYGID